MCSSRCCISARPGILSEGQITAPLRAPAARPAQRRLHRWPRSSISMPTGRALIWPAADRRADSSSATTSSIIAAGVRQSYFGHDEFAALAPGMKTISRRAHDQAPGLRRVRDGRDRHRPGRAAPTGSRSRWSAPGRPGVELAGQIRELATKTLRAEYRTDRARRCRGCCSSTAAARRWPRSAPSCRSKAARGARRRWASSCSMGSIVTDVDLGGLLVRDQRRRTRPATDAATVLWTAGVEAPPLAAAVGQGHRRQARQGAAGSSCEDDLTIPGHPEISVIGDMMSLRKLPGRRRGGHADQASTPGTGSGASWPAD